MSNPETQAFEVHQGRMRTPFYERMLQLDKTNTWHNWKGYSTPDELYCSETEYFAIRNATAVFDVSPMTKYRITGPDSTAFLNRLVTRDMTKIKPGRVAYAVWCDDQARYSTTERFSICAKVTIACARRSGITTGSWHRRSALTSASKLKRKMSADWLYRARRPTRP